MRSIFASLRANRNLTVFLVAIVLMEIVHGVEAMALFPLYLTEILGSSVTMVGATISTFLVVDISIRTPAGWLADRWGRKAILVGGIALSSAPLALMMKVQSPHVFLVLNAVNGLGAGCIWPAIYAGVADTYGRHERGLILGVLSTVMLGGLALGPIAGNILLAFVSYQSTFLICIALVCMALLLVLSLASETSMAPIAGDPEGAEIHLASWAGELIVLGAVAMLLTVSLALLLPIISLYGARILQVSKATLALILAICGGFTALALLPAGHLADRIGRKPLIVAGLALLTLCYAGAPSTTNLVLVTAGATCAGLGYALAVPAWNALAMDRIPGESRGTLLGAVATVQGAGLAVGPIVGGFLWERVNPYAPFMAGAGLLFLATLLSLRLRQPQG
jgi:DHA1 family multidrug resistance protein-like MFS transporter